MITYFCNDGVITRAERNSGLFQTRSYRTGSWVTTKDPRLIQKMLNGQGAISQIKADQLFRDFKNNNIL